MDTAWQQFRNTAIVRLFAFAKIPLLGFVRPTLLQLNDEKIVLKIPLGRRSKNHLGTMYFGALAMGAEAAVAARAVYDIRESGQKVDFLFKDFTANFLKRAEGDVHFICEEGKGVRELVQKAILTGERVTQTFRSYAVVPKADPNAVIAEFTVSLSVKLRKKKLDA